MSACSGVSSSCGRRLHDHTTANTDWGTLPLSGTFPQMLSRLQALGVAWDTTRQRWFSLLADDPPPPDGWPLRWRDVTDDMVRLGFAPKFPRSRWVELTHFDAHDARRWSIVEVDEDLWIFTTCGAEPDTDTIIVLVGDLRRFDAGVGTLHREDLTITEEIAREAKIAEALRSLRGVAA